MARTETGKSNPSAAAQERAERPSVDTDIECFAASSPVSWSAADHTALVEESRRHSGVAGATSEFAAKLKASQWWSTGVNQPLLAVGLVREHSLRCTVAESIDP